MVILLNVRALLYYYIVMPDSAGESFKGALGGERHGHLHRKVYPRQRRGLTAPGGIDANALPGADVIGFNASFNGEVGDIIRLTSGQIDITDTLTIDGGRGVTITGDANGDDITFAGAIPTSPRASGKRTGSTTMAASSTRLPRSPSTI